MKRNAKLIMAIVFAMITLTSGAIIKNNVATHITKPFVKTKAPATHDEGAPLCFWTRNCHYGAIQIYVNNVYKGSITKCYGATPTCASDGCVTVIIYGTNNYWRAQTTDGNTKWDSKPCRIPDNVCNTEELR